MCFDGRKPVECPACRGFGLLEDEECHLCAGHGTIHPDLRARVLRVRAERSRAVREDLNLERRG